MSANWWEKDAVNSPSGDDWYSKDKVVSGGPEKKATALDYAKGVASGVGQLVSGIGYLGEKVGADKVGKSIRDVGDQASKYWVDSMTDAGKAATQEQVFKDDPNSALPSIGDHWGQALVMGAAQSAPSMLAGAGIGAPIAGGIAKGAGMLAARGVGGAVAPLVAGTASPVGGWAANTAGQIAARVPSAVGMGAGEGISAGAMNAGQMKSQIEAMPEAELMKSPAYTALLAQVGPVEARKQLAENASGDVFANTTLSTGGIGALTGGGALGAAYRNMTGVTKDGLVKSVLKGAGEEALQETPQSGAERYIQNVATQKYIDPNQRLSESVVADALSGGAVGGLMGGVTGAGGHALSREPQKPSGPLGKTLAAGGVTQPTRPAGPTLALPNLPAEPLIVFPDGSTGTRKQVDGYLAGLAPEQRPAVMAKLLYGDGVVPSKIDDTNALADEWERFITDEANHQTSRVQDQIGRNAANERNRSVLAQVADEEGQQQQDIAPPVLPSTTVNPEDKQKAAAIDTAIAPKNTAIAESQSQQGTIAGKLPQSDPAIAPGIGDALPQTTTNKAGAGLGRVLTALETKYETAKTAGDNDAMRKLAHEINVERQSSKAPKAEPSAKTEHVLSLGVAPNSAEPITVKEGVVHVGKYAAQDFDSGEDVRVSADATPHQIRDALAKAGVIAKGQKVFGLPKEEAPAITQDMTVPADTITLSGGRPYVSENAAKQGAKKNGVTETHAIVPSDDGRGFVLRRKAITQEGSNAPNEPVTTQAVAKEVPAAAIDTGKQNAEQSAPAQAGASATSVSSPVTVRKAGEGAVAITFDPSATPTTEKSSSVATDSLTTAENIKRGQEAMERVIATQSDEQHAMQRPDHGWVSFVWGKIGNAERDFAGGHGIAKIIAKRKSEGADGEAVARKMTEVIGLGEAGPVYGPKGGERFNVSYDGHTAVLSLHRFGKEQTWLLTGWDDVVSDGAEAGNTSGTYAPDSSGIRKQEGAEDNSTLAQTTTNDYSAKWFGSKGKAEDFIAKQGIGATHQASLSDRKWLIAPKQADSTMGISATVADPIDALRGKIMDAYAESTPHKEMPVGLAKTAEAMYQAIMARDADKLADILNLDNKTSRAAFAKIINQHLPKTVKGTREVVDGFVAKLKAADKPAGGDLLKERIKSDVAKAKAAKEAGEQAYRDGKDRMPPQDGGSAEVKAWLEGFDGAAPTVDEYADYKKILIKAGEAVEIDGKSYRVRNDYSEGHRKAGDPVSVRTTAQVAEVKEFPYSALQAEAKPAEDLGAMFDDLMGEIGAGAEVSKAANRNKLAETKKRRADEKPAESADRFGSGASESLSAAESELRALAFDKIQKTGKEGDVRLQNGRYVTFDDAMRYVREAVAAGTRPVPFQIHAKLDIAIGETDRLIAALENKPKPVTPQIAPATTSRPKFGDPGYTLAMAEADLAEMQAEQKAQGQVSDARLDDRVKRFTKIVADMKAEAPRTAGQAAVSAAKNTADGFQNAIAGLGKLFGGAGKMSSGLTFDEKTYEQAKPLFSAAVANFKQAGSDLKDVMKAVMLAVREQFGDAVLGNMKPYIVRYVEDVRDGKIDYAGGKEASTNEQSTTTGAAGNGALEGTPSEEVSGTESSGNAGTDGARRSGKNDAGASGTGSEGVSTGSGLGSGAGDVPVPARRSRKQPGSAGLGSVQGDSPAKQTAVEKPADYVITEATRLGEGGVVTKYRNNVAAIRLVNELEQAGRTATAEEQHVLARYVGWGALSQVFDPEHKDWTKEHTELKALLTPEEWEAAEMSTQYAHYTSEKVITHGIYAGLQHFGFTGGKILEPGSGVGNTAGLMPTAFKTSGARITGIERERISARIAQHLYPNQVMLLEDFTKFNAADGEFDAVAGNPPFSSTSLIDLSGRKHLNGLSIHNFFFAKSIDMLRPGGVFAMVVSNGFMDAKTDRARAYIGKHAKLLGAIRLPNNAFKSNAGTDVTTDIVYFQKRNEADFDSKEAKADLKAWNEIVTVDDPLGGEPIPLNAYFAANPHMMLGRMERSGKQYRAASAALVDDGKGDITERLKAAIATMPANVYQAAIADRAAKTQQEAIVALQDKAQEVGSYFTQEGKLFVRIPDAAGEKLAQEVTANTQWTEKTVLGIKKWNHLKALAELRATTGNLLAAELADNQADMDKLRADLNAQYDKIVKDFGYHLGADYTRQLIGDDPYYPLLAALETGFDKGITAAAAKKQGVAEVKPSAKKMPIFRQRVISKLESVSSAETPVDALMVSISEHGRIDAAYMASLLRRTDVDEILAELEKQGHLFKDPRTDSFVLRDEYLSGNVRKKLEIAKRAGLYKHVEALEAVLPEDVPAHDIVGKLGAAWVPTSVYESFAETLFGEGTDATISYQPITGSYQARIAAGSEVANSNTWGTNKISGADILARLLNKREIKIGNYDDKGKFHLDAEGTLAANDKAAEIKTKFGDWLFQDADRAENMVRAYNDTVNNYVTRKFDGALLRFVGKVPDAIIKLRRHQRNAVSRVIQMGQGLLDHVVGSGKTFTVIASAMELRRTGLANKPMIAVPNHLVKQWATDFYRLYPNAKILAATKKDFEKNNRREFLARIATGDWDAVIIAHSSFGFIKPDPVFEEKFNNEQIAGIMAAIEELGGEVSGGRNDKSDGRDKETKRTVKQLMKLKEGLENRIKSLRDKPMDNLLDFAQIGVDQLFVDEAHQFKNLMYATKMSNVRGLNDPKGSQRAFDLYIKASQIMEKHGADRGVVFATGTPVSNSLAEMYHMMRYLIPSTLSEMGFKNFDAWADTFASVDQVWMQAMSGAGYKATNRMSNFVNAPELLKVFDQVADTVTNEDVQKAYSEENNGAEFPLPKVKGGRREPVSLVRTAAQTAYMEDIADRAKALEKRKGPPKKGEDNMLSILGDARKAAMDIRLVDPSITERDPQGRIALAAESIAGFYQKYDAVKGTQLVFSDMGTPLKTVKKELAEYQELADVIAKGSNEDITTRADLGDEAAQKLVSEAEEAQEVLDAKGKDWLDAIKAALRGFSIYDDMKAALIEKGIPENEIAFIHDYNTDDQKAALFKAVNNGKIRVLLGSTPKMGAGTNVQERLVALHHLDVPWRPSDVEQREGRIIRQGNKLAYSGNETETDETIPGFEVSIRAYATQDTLDLFMWQLQEKKLHMIGQLRTGKVGREIDNAFEELEMSAGEMQAAATSNPYLMDEIRVKDQIKKLERKKRAFESQQNDVLNRRNRAIRDAEALPETIARLEKGVAAYNDYQNGVSDAIANMEATVLGERVIGRAKIQEAVANAVRAMELPITVDINGTEFRTEESAIDFIGENYFTISNWTLNGHIFAKAKMKDAVRDLHRETAYAAIKENGFSFNGKTYKSATSLGEAVKTIAGDKEPILLTVNGEAFNRRTPAEKAFAPTLEDAIETDTEKSIFKLGTFEVFAEGVHLGDNKVAVSYRVAYPGGEFDGEISFADESSDAVKGAAPRLLIRDVINRIEGMQGSLGWNKNSLAKAQKTIADTDNLKTGTVWPDESELTQARAKHKEILAKLNAINNGQKFGLEREQELEDRWAAKTGAITPLFSRPSDSIGAGQTAAAVRAEVAAKIGQAKFAQLERKGLAIIHETADTLPAKAQEYPDAWGWFDGKTIHLIASNLSVGQAVGVFEHEAWHAALRSLRLSESPLFAKIMERLGKIEQNGAASDWFKQARKMIPAEDQGNDARRLNEMAAYAIQQYESEPQSLPVLIRRFVQDLLASVRAFFMEKLGWVPENLTAQDLAALTRRYVRSMADGDSTVGPMGGEALAARNTNSEFVAEFLNELSFEDAAFRYPISASNTLEGNILSAMPGAEYLGEDTRPDEKEESKADKRFVFATPNGTLFYVFSRGNEIWIDVSRLKNGDGGSAIYHGVANYAYNAGKVFVGDPNGLSEDAVIRRTAAMLSSALRFGTTRHLGAAKEQLVGAPEKGIEPLAWKDGDDIANVDALIHTYLSTLHQQFPAIKNYRYDFDRFQFVDSRGRPLDASRLERGQGTPGARASRSGEASLRRGIFLQSLASSPSSERSKLLEIVLSRSVQLASDEGGLKGVFSRPSAAFIQQATDRVTDLFQTSKTFNVWHKTVGTQFHKASVDKDFGRVFKIGQKFLQDTSQIAMDAADLAPNLLPKLGSIKDIFKRGPKKADLDAVSKVVFQGTLDDKLYSAAELRTLGLSDQQVALYNEFRASIDRSIDDLFVSEMTRQLRSQLPDLGRRLVGMSGEDANATAIGMLNDLLDEQKMVSQDAQSPTIKAKADAAIADLKAQIKQLAKQFNKVQKLKADGYAPLTRFGQYTVDVTQDGQNGEPERVFFGMYESEREANAAARKFRADPLMQVSQGVMSQEDWRMFQGVSPDSLELFADALGADQSEVFQKYLKLTLNNRSAMKRLIHRQGIAGFSQDVTRVLATFITSNARLSARNLNMMLLKEAVDAIPKAKGDVKDEAVKLANYLTDPKEEAQALRGWMFVHFIGGSVASAITNLTQPLTMTVPYLSQFGTGAAAKAMASAAKVLNRKLTGDTRLDAALHKAEAEGITAPHEIHQLYAESIRSLGSNEAIRKGLTAWGQAFALAESFNRRITFIAAFKMAQENPALGNAFAFAERAVEETQGIYNKGNRPDWARGAMGATIFTFKQFSISYIEFLKRLPPKQKALALAILLIAAGLQGLPFAEDIQDLIDTIGQSFGYNTNSKRWMHEFAVRQLGSGMGEFLTNGFSAIPGMPLDVQARMGLGNLIPGTAIFKQSEKDKGRDVLEFVGPAGALVKAGMDSFTAAQQGRFGAAGAALMPVAIKNFLKAAEMQQTGEYRDASGKKVIETTGYDAAIKAIGFQPAKVAKESRTVYEDKQSIDMQRSVESEIADRWARGIIDKDPEAVRSARADLADWNLKNPESRVVIQPSQIFRRVKEAKMTREQRFIKSAPTEMRRQIAQDLRGG